MKKKLHGKSPWFKKTNEKDSGHPQTTRQGRRKRKGDQELPPQLSSVVFVPKTQDSGLAKRLQEAEVRLAAVTR